MKEKYETIIVGAGPAGLAAALTLNKLGRTDVLVLERYSFPRYKCCAGYMTHKTKKEYELFGLDTDDIHYSLIKDFNIFYRLKNRQTIVNKFLYTNRKIDRVELDNAFFDTAKESGVQVSENTNIISHCPEEKYIIVSGRQKISYDNIVFADGTEGYGSRYQRLSAKNIAMQLVFPCLKEEEIQIHFGITEKGYGWFSSFGGTANLGLTDIYDPAKDYGRIFREFMDKLNIQADMKELKGAFTPIGTAVPIMEGNMYFAGDAVGACDPLTLSGLRYALASGRMCAKAIAEEDDSIYLKYVRRLKIRFVIMKTMMKIFYLKPVQFCVFNIGCRFFGGIIAAVFNNFFVNKK